MKYALAKKIIIMALKRRQNFSKSELEMLTVEVERHKEVLFSKLNNSVTKSAKDRLWQVIADRVNGVQDGVCRTAEEVRKKWSNVASDFKKREALQRREYKKTGGGPAAEGSYRTPIDEKLAGVVGETAIAGIEGGIDLSDQLLPVTSIGRSGITFLLMLRF